MKKEKLLYFCDDFGSVCVMAEGKPGVCRFEGLQPDGHGEYWHPLDGNGKFMTLPPDAVPITAEKVRQMVRLFRSSQKTP